MIIDVHAHFTLTAQPPVGGPRFSFEPPEGFDSFVSPRAARRLVWRLAARMMGIRGRPAPGPALDAELWRYYGAQLGLHPDLLDERPRATVRRAAPGDGAVAREVEKTVLLAFDAYHDDAGRRPPPPADAREPGSDIYTSNSLIRRLCERSGGRFLFGASVHPYRAGAVAAVEEVFAAGACLLKWIPLHQNIDIADPRTLAVLRCCARLGLPLLLHYNEEFTLTTNHREYQDVSAVLDVLRRLHARGAMPVTILAHVATPVTVLGARGDHELLVEALLGDLAGAPLYADISALTTWGKLRYLRPLARRQELHGRLLFGSDFPVPVAMLRLRRWLGRDYAALAAAPDPERMLAIFRRAGFNEIVFHRAAQLLPHVRHFDPPDRAHVGVQPA